MQSAHQHPSAGAHFPKGSPLNFSMEFATPSLEPGEMRRSSRIQAASSSRGSSMNLSARSTPAITSSRSTPAEKSSWSTPQEIVEERDACPDPTPSKRPGLRTRKPPAVIEDDPLEEAMKPLTDEERRNWKGWVELESDPVSYELIRSSYNPQWMILLWPWAYE